MAQKSNKNKKRYGMLAAAMKTLDEELIAGAKPGVWLAISSDQQTVVGSGQTMEEALAAAKESGEAKPFIVRVPTENSTLVL
jgi:predicted metalloprotease